MDHGLQNVSQPCPTRLTLTDLYPDQFAYYPLLVGIDRYNGSCNTAEDPFSRICVPYEAEHVNSKVFNMIL